MSNALVTRIVQCFTQWNLCIFSLQALLNVSSLLLSPMSVPLWEGTSDVDTAVGDLLVAVNGIGEALILLANQSSTQIVTLQTDNIGEWVPS